MPGGQARDNESHFDTARRRLAELLGVHIIRLDAPVSASPVRVVDGGVAYDIFTYAIHPDAWQGSVRPLEDYRGQQICWWPMNGGPTDEASSTSLQTARISLDHTVASFDVGSECAVCLFPDAVFLCSLCGRRFHHSCQEDLGLRPPSNRTAQEGRHLAAEGSRHGPWCCSRCSTAQLPGTDSHSATEGVSTDGENANGEARAAEIEGRQLRFGQRTHHQALRSFALLSNGAGGPQPDACGETDASSGTAPPSMTAEVVVATPMLEAQMEPTELPPSRVTIRSSTSAVMPGVLPSTINTTGSTELAVVSPGDEHEECDSLRLTPLVDEVSGALACSYDGCSAPQLQGCALGACSMVHCEVEAASQAPCASAHIESLPLPLRALATSGSLPEGMVLQSPRCSLHSRVCRTQGCAGLHHLDSCALCARCCESVIGSTALSEAVYSCVDVRRPADHPCTGGVCVVPGYAECPDRDWVVGQLASPRLPYDR